MPKHQGAAEIERGLDAAWERVVWTAKRPNNRFGERIAARQDAARILVTRYLDAVSQGMSVKWLREKAAGNERPEA